MLKPLPHPTINEYHRDFQAGILINSCFRECPECGSRVYLSLRHRVFLDIYYYRGRCVGECRKHYSFLPRFVVPNKWYSSIEISEAAEFIKQTRFSSVSAALEEWEIERENRIFEGLTAGPCRTTVYNWHKEQQAKSVESSDLGDSGTSHAIAKGTVSPAIQPGKLSSLAVSRVLSTSDVAGAESGFGAFYLLRISSFLILAFSFLFAGNKTSCMSVFKDFIDSSHFWIEDWITLGDFEAETRVNRGCPEAEYNFETHSGYRVFAGIPP